MPQETKGQAETLDRRMLAVAAFIVVIIGGSIAAAAYFAVSGKTVYIDKAQVQAPLVALSPTSSGILRTVYVHEGDRISPSTIVAQVGVELIKSTTGGLVVAANNDIGKVVSPQETIVSMIDPSALRVVGQVDEDKGLVDIHVGQRAVFTIDAYGGMKYDGVVDEVSPASHQGDIVFSISDKRQVQKFDIKIRFDTNAYPELKNGMSARIWIYKK